MRTAPALFALLLVVAGALAPLAHATSFENTFEVGSYDDGFTVPVTLPLDQNYNITIVNTCDAAVSYVILYNADDTANITFTDSTTDIVATGDPGFTVAGDNDNFTIAYLEAAESYGVGAEHTHSDTLETVYAGVRVVLASEPTTGTCVVSIDTASDYVPLSAVSITFWVLGVMPLLILVKIAGRLNMRA